MRVPFIYLALGVLPVFGEGLEVPIDLYNEFQQAPPATVLESIQEELHAILRPAGLSFNWRPLEGADRQVSVELVIIRFNGQCDANDLKPEKGYSGPLGWTYLSEGEIIPFVGINCDGVRILLQQDLLGLPEPARSRAFGRALARVLAHELYHVLSKTTRHGWTGIAKAAYSARELLSDEFRFNRKQSALLRAHSAYLAASSAWFRY